MSDLANANRVRLTRDISWPGIVIPAETIGTITYDEQRDAILFVPDSLELQKASGSPFECGDRDFDSMSTNLRGEAVVYQMVV